MLALVVAGAPEIARAKCAFGAMPDYADITSVAITQRGCGSTLAHGPAVDLKCSKFWATFDADGEAEYSQYDLQDAAGDFDLAVPIGQARAILERNKFFDLNPPAQQAPTDTSALSIAVWYCASVRAMKVYAGSFAKPQIDDRVAALFDQFRALISASKKAKRDDHPHVLSQVFDPWY